MFRGYRHIVLAIGLVLYASLAHSQDQPDAALADNDERGERGSVQNQTEAKQEPPQPSAVPTIGADRTLPEPDPENYQTPCDAPKTDDDADLCQQWRMAEAAEETADWAFGQIIATGFEAVLLAIAIGVAFWAGSWAKSAAVAGQKMVREASKATSAAQKSVEVTRDIGQRQIRAYMATDASNIKWVRDAKNTNIYGVHVQWKNCGDTPARRCHGRASARVFDDVMPADFDYPDVVIPSVTETNHVGPSQFLWFRSDGIDGQDVLAAERGKKHIYVWSWVEYDDVFRSAPEGLRRRTELCFKLHISDSGATCFASISGPFNGGDEDCHHQTKT